jgi:hypothetical protein
MSCDITTSNCETQGSQVVLEALVPNNVELSAVPGDVHIPSTILEVLSVPVESRFPTE